MLCLCTPLSIRIFFAGVVLGGLRRLQVVLLLISSLAEFLLGVYAIDQSEVQRQQKDVLDYVTGFPFNYVDNGVLIAKLV